MSFTNPKPSGYLTGERLPSTDVNTVWANVAKALDGEGGGSYALTGALSLTCSGAGAFTIAGLLTVNTKGIVMGAGTVHTEQGRNIKSGSGASTSWRQTSIAATDYIDTSNDYWEVGAIAGNIVLTLRSVTGSPLPDGGEVVQVDRWVHLDAFTVTVKREDGTTLATFAASLKGFAKFRYNASNVWVPCEWGGGVTV